jgi:TonB family protein
MRYLRIAVGVLMLAALSAANAASPSVSTVEATKCAIYMPAPDYPLSARQRHSTGAGIFVLRVQIKTGRVKAVEVARTTGDPVLDAAATKTLKRWLFKPSALPRIKDFWPEAKDPFATEDSLLKIPIRFVL